MKIFKYFLALQLIGCSVFFALETIAMEPEIAPVRRSLNPNQPFKMGHAPRLFSNSEPLNNKKPYKTPRAAPGLKTDLVSSVMKTAARSKYFTPNPYARPKGLLDKAYEYKTPRLGFLRSNKGPGMKTGGDPYAQPDNKRPASASAASPVDVKNKKEKAKLRIRFTNSSRILAESKKTTAHPK